MNYYRIATPNPLSGCLTYAHEAEIMLGARVSVPFRRRMQAGIVWEKLAQPDLAADKILPIACVFDEPALPREWRALLDFAARYYHYLLGNAVFAALPPALRQPKPFHAPVHEYWRLTDAARALPEPRLALQKRLWRALRHPVFSGSLKAPERRYTTLWREAGHLENTQPALLSTPPFALNDEQRQAAQRIQSAQDFEAFLLYGVTGSGKTEVYLEAMAATLSRQRQVLLMLPEINLTPQLLARIQQHFPGLQSIVLTSQTSAAQRSAGYVRAMRGEILLVIGTRLAVFTPLPALGLIVVDEEHDASYKQDSDLRYQARDLAVWRAKMQACPIVLASATPSLESWRHTQNQRYRLLTLSARASTRLVPAIDVVDVRQQSLTEGLSPIALQALKNNLGVGMSLVYLNRRGFAPVLFCGDCGHRFFCPHCSAGLVVHRRARQLRCHHCGHQEPLAHACPACGNQDLSAVGQGTQRLEESLRAHLDGVVLRIDRDSISTRRAWEDTLDAIQSGAPDILIGTQMLAKGHDFARLNLAVVVNADASLFSHDFRAPERLMAELMQVSGRVGRHELPGRVFVQTLWPEHPVFAALLAQDYGQFAHKELQARQDFSLPPFVHAAAIRADSPAPGEAWQWLQAALTRLHGAQPADVTIFGPIERRMPRMQARERVQCLMESPSRQHLHEALSLWENDLRATRQSSHLRWHIDVDPIED